MVYNCRLVQLVTVSAAHFGLMGKRRKCELIITVLTRWDNQVKWFRMDFTFQGFNEANIQSSSTAAPSAHQDMMKWSNLMNTSQCWLPTLGGITFIYLFLQWSSQSKQKVAADFQLSQFSPPCCLTGKRQKCEIITISAQHKEMNLLNLNSLDLH